MPLTYAALLGVSRQTLHSWRRRYGLSTSDTLRDLARLVGARALAVVVDECPSGLYYPASRLPEWLRKRVLGGRLQAWRWRMVPMVCLEDVVENLPAHSVGSAAWWATRLEPVEASVAIELFSTFLAWRTSREFWRVSRYMEELRSAIYSVYAKYATRSPTDSPRPG